MSFLEHGLFPLFFSFNLDFCASLLKWELCCMGLGRADQCVRTKNTARTEDEVLAF